MKKILKTVVMVMLVFACFPMRGLATSAPNREVSVFVEGYPIKLSHPAMVVNGRVLVPFRSIFEALGLEVSWEPTTQTVSGGDANAWVSFVLGQDFAIVDGEKVPLDVPAQAVSGHTLVPIRFVGESTGFGVDWDQANYRVLVGGKEVFGDIRLSSTQTPANLYQLRAEQGVGEYSGYTKLQGYPGDNKFDVYCKYSIDGSVLSSAITYDDKRGYDLNELVYWKYKSATHVSTRLQIYNFCRESSKLASALGINHSDALGTFTPQWLSDTFGQVYHDYIELRLFEQDAETIAEAYIDYVSGIDASGHQNSTTLKPDSEVSFEYSTDGWIEERNLQHYGIRLDFSIVTSNSDTGYSMSYVIVDSVSGERLYTLGSLDPVYQAQSSHSAVSINKIRIEAREGNSGYVLWLNEADLVELGLIK